VIRSGGRGCILYFLWYLRGVEYFILKINTAGTSEMLVPVQQNMHCHIPEGSYLQSALELQPPDAEVRYSTVTAYIADI
jgi:hypothetical protein